MPKRATSSAHAPFVVDVATHFRALIADVAAADGIPKPSQPAIARRIGRAQSYVQTRMAGRAPLDTEIIDAAAELLNVDGADFLLDLARRVSGVRGSTDAEVLDTLPQSGVTSGAYGLAARRRAPGEQGDPSGGPDGGSEPAAG